MKQSGGPDTEAAGSTENGGARKLRQKVTDGVAVTTKQRMHENIHENSGAVTTKQPGKRIGCLLLRC